ncbi:hypothetical protein BAZSYMB_SCAFFOLD00080_3 [Bathymodiolus azoricus thioautotrophic gill symbiont]|uniref:Uncharacterized protein n=1 Tax=Bathymodiolus azoricus thioautotrophic gill symbiont TaxID=235205 RepID=A0A1H6LC92_9GAMM|nr:hypothetical protein BAZSYMB_SCAFFOLD00080_3 [Bathymodiolus azoricus thioautotrophic gill symbiont]
MPSPIANLVSTCVAYNVSGILSMSMASDEPSEFASPSFKPFNTSPTRLDSSVCLVIIFKSPFH